MSAFNPTAPPPASVHELIDAAAIGNIDAVEALLSVRKEIRAEREQLGDCELMALTNAVIGGHGDVVKFLLNAETAYFAKVFSSVNAMWGFEAFNAAAERGSVEMLQLLCEAGLTTDPRTGGFLLAATNGHVAAVEFLLVSKVSSVDQLKKTLRGTKCPTALWAASDAGHSDVVKVLLEWGADVNFVFEGQTSLRRAIAGGHGDVSEMLIAAGGKADAPAAKKTAKLDIGRFSALNLKLAKPATLVEESRKKGTQTSQKLSRWGEDLRACREKDRQVGHWEVLSAQPEDRKAEHRGGGVATEGGADLTRVK